MGYAQGKEEPMMAEFLDAWFQAYVVGVYAGAAVAVVVTRNPLQAAVLLGWWREY